MNPIFQNFFSIIRRYRLAVVLNILGLSVAFAAFMIIMIQVHDDYRFDKCHTDYDKIFRLEFTMNAETNAVVERRMAGHFFESSPAIVAGTVIKFTPGWVVSSLGEINRRGYYKEQTLQVSPGFTDVFTFDFVEGDKDALKKPGQVIIPLSLARKLFGKKSPVGQLLDDSSGESRMVGAVYRDFPANTIVNNCIYSVLPENEDLGQSYMAYFRINQAVQTPRPVDDLIRNFDGKAVYGDVWDRLGIELHCTALPDVH